MVIDSSTRSKLHRFMRNSGLSAFDIEHEEIPGIMERLGKVCISTEDFTKFMSVMTFIMDILDNTTEADDMNCSLYCNLNVSNNIYKFNILHSELKQLLIEELDKYLKEFVLWCDSNEVARRAFLGEQFINLLSFGLDGGYEFLSLKSSDESEISACSTFRNFLIACYSVGVSTMIEYYLEYGRGSERFMYNREFSKTERCKTIRSLKEPIMESFFNNYSEGVISQFKCYGGDYY